MDFHFVQTAEIQAGKQCHAEYGLELFQDAAGSNFASWYFITCFYNKAQARFQNKCFINYLENWQNDFMLVGAWQVSLQVARSA